MPVSGTPGVENAEPAVIVVIGAGPAGLAAALHAARAGQDVTVLERADRVGGMAGSFDVAGVRVDHGSHRLHPSTDPAILAELRDLLGADLQTRPRHGRIRLAGRWVGFPLRTTNLLRSVPPSFAARAAFDAVTSPFRRARSDTFSEVVRAGLGPTIAHEFYEPYARKLWGTDPERLSGELARRRISASSPSRLVRKLVGGPAVFLYPRTGFGLISERLADAAVDAGAKIRLGTGVERLDVSDDRVDVALDSGDHIDATGVWSTAPVAALTRMVHPTPPDAVTEASRRLRHRALDLVYLVFDRPQITPFDAHYFPSDANPVARLSEPRNYRDNPDDPPDRTVLCAEVPCWPHEILASDAAAELVIDAVRRDGLELPDPSAVELRRLPSVYPVYEPDSEWDLAAVELWLGSHPRLRTFGRQGLFVPDNTHHVLAMGMAAAVPPVEAASWSRARDDFRAHVVED